MRFENKMKPAFSELDFLIQLGYFESDYDFLTLSY